MSTEQVIPPSTAIERLLRTIDSIASFAGSTLRTNSRDISEWAYDFETIKALAEKEAATYRAAVQAIPMCERCNGTGRQFVGGHESEAICRTCDGAGYVATAPAAGAFTSSPQKGTPGHCHNAQVWDAEGNSAAVLDSTADPTVASERARIMAQALSATPPAPVVHGANCPKEPHTRGGELHAPDDDTPYNVDGCIYCGRCHRWLSPEERGVATAQDHRSSPPEHSDQINPKAVPGVSQAEPLTVQACRPEDRAMLQTAAGAEMVLKAALVIGGSYTCPICGTATPHSHSGAEIVAWRRAQGKTMLYNPFTGCPRDQADIEEDPSGIFLTAITSVPRKKWAPSAAALQAELPAVADALEYPKSSEGTIRCTCNEYPHAHGCGSVIGQRGWEAGYAYAIATEAVEARAPLTDEQIDQVSTTARFLGLHRAPLKAIRVFARSMERAHGISASAQAGEGAQA